MDEWPLTCTLVQMYCTLWRRTYWASGRRPAGEGAARPGACGGSFCWERNCEPANESRQAQRSCASVLSISTAVRNKWSDLTPSHREAQRKDGSWYIGSNYIPKSNDSFSLSVMTAFVSCRINAMVFADIIAFQGISTRASKGNIHLVYG